MTRAQAPDLLDRVLDDHGDALFDFALAVTGRVEVAVEAVREAIPAALETHGPSASRAALLGSVLEAALRRVPAEAPAELPRGLLEPGGGPGGPGVSPYVPGGPGVSPCVPGGPGVSPCVSADELARLSWDATRALDPRHRGILDLTLRQGLEGEALSEALGVAAGQASATTQAALEQAEHVVGAVLLTHVARGDCPGLAAVLESLPAEPGPDRMAADVESHRETCPACDDRRRSLVPVATLLAAAPSTPAPPELRQARLGRRTVPEEGSPRRRGRTVAAAVAAVLAVAAAGLLLARRDEGGNLALPAAAAGRLAVGQAAIDLGPQEQNETFTLANTGGGVLEYRVLAAAPWLRVIRGSEGRIASGRDVTLAVTLDRSRAPEGEATSELRVTSSSGSAVLPVRAAVERAPVLAQMEASPQPVTPLGCPGATPAQVRVTVVEESGLAYVELHWRTRDRAVRVVEMAEEARSWSAPMGPFEGPGDVAWWIEATDIRGNTTLSPTQTLPVVAC